MLEPQHWELKQILYEPGARIDALYFPVDAVVSVLTTLSDGAGVEIATIGNEGMVGSPLVLGSNTMPAREFCQVQVPGQLLRMDREAFADVHSEHDPFREILQLYIQALFSQISQQVACNALHSIEERCSRWLLLTHDRVHSDSFPLTQEFLSQMLGVRRASVTLAAGALQTAGLIRYRRGQMVIQDREGLENASCECYAVLRNEYDRLFGPAADPTNEATPRPRHDAMRIPRRPNQRVASQSVRLLSFAI
jgi:CRP-like cAMP-binding protein